MRCSNLALSVAIGCLASCARPEAPAETAVAPRAESGRPPTDQEVEFLCEWLRADVRRNPAGLKTAAERDAWNARRKRLADTLDVLSPGAPQPSRFGQLERILNVLMAHGILHDGIPEQQAVALLGPPTDRSDGNIAWYHNYAGWHVFPCLCAKEADGVLTGFRFVMR